MREAWSKTMSKFPYLGHEQRHPGGKFGVVGGRLVDLGREVVPFPELVRKPRAGALKAGIGHNIGSQAPVNIHKQALQGHYVE